MTTTTTTTLDDFDSKRGDSSTRSDSRRSRLAAETSFLLTSSLRVLSHEHHAEPPRGITFDDVAYF